MDDSIEVLVPIWVLKNKVEDDYEEYMFMSGSLSNSDIDDPEPQNFPLYDSTKKCLEILENYSILFNKVTGVWY